MAARATSSGDVQPPFSMGAARVSPIDDGAVLERLVRLRGACQALAFDLAASRRELKAVQAELRRVKGAGRGADRP